MNRYSLPQEAVDSFKAEGFRVYMRDRAVSYAMVENASGVAYVEYDPMRGYSVGTVHASNRESGTGYQIARHVPIVTGDMLREAVRTTIPVWAPRGKTPHKYGTMGAFRAASAWNAGYKEI